MPSAPESRICQNCKQNFTIEPDDFGFYEKIAVPAPTWCPECRNQRRLSWRNERSLHKRKCDAPGHSEEIISMYRPGVGRVYDNAFWWGDAWDAMQYGRDYDFNKSFFQQYRELLGEVPLPNLSVINSTNSEYSNWTEFNKNCYLVFAAGLNENVRFANKSLDGKDTQDVLYIGHVELGYELVNCFNSYRLMFSANCKSCTDSAFLYECRDCNNCFGCTNLISKSYCLFNEQFSKEEYKKRLAEIDLGSFSTIQNLKKEFAERLLGGTIHRASRIVGSTNCTGNDINNSKNCKSCFDIFEDMEDSKFSVTTMKSKELYDSMGQWKMNFSYENVDNNVGTNVAFSITTYTSHDVRYCMSCHSSSNLFGCVGLRSKEYCILNKQYTPDEYRQLVEKIKIQMTNDKEFGEFFSPELSPFAYNETIAQEYFPLTKEQALAKDYRWLDPEAKHYQVTKQATDLPDHIRDVNESILTEVIGCENSPDASGSGSRPQASACTTAFKIIPQELQFYQRMNLPLPRLCPNCRHYARLAQRNPLKLWHRQCMCEQSHAHHEGKCSNEFETSYAPDRKETVYCETCYQAEVA